MHRLIVAFFLILLGISVFAVAQVAAHGEAMSSVSSGYIIASAEGSSSDRPAAMTGHKCCICHVHQADVTRTTYATVASAPRVKPVALAQVADRPSTAPCSVLRPPIA